MIFDSKKVANETILDLKQDFLELKCRLPINPSLIIFTSNDPASQVYVKNKIKCGNEVGVNVVTFSVSSAEDIRSTLECTSAPFIIQLPNDNLTEREIDSILCDYVDRDVDGFSSRNIGLIAQGVEPVWYYPCTPKGVIRLLNYYKIDCTGKNVLILGRSNIVGKPLSYMLTSRNATVTLAHSKTDWSRLEYLVYGADIIVFATGKRDMLKGISNLNGTILIDVGINRNEEGKLCGDFYLPILDSALAYSPVPNGIGPMTVAMLFENVFNYWKNYCDLLDAL